MSGFLVGMGEIAPDSLGRAAKGLSFSPKAASGTRTVPPFFFATSRFDDPGLWAPAHDSARNLTVILAGRIALERAQWHSARELPYQGGAACRHILEGLRARGPGFLEELNGAFAVAVVDSARGELTVVTDRMGFIPVYGAQRGGQHLIATHADVLAAAAPWAADLDVTTMAEMLSHWHGVHPYTFYRGIRQLDAGTVYSWDREGRQSSRRYWAPAYKAEAGASQEELGEDLAAAIRRSVQLRSQPLLGETGVFLSGGADSRAVLFALHEPSKANCFTFYDEENSELATARELAIRAGARHVGLQREAEHYGKGAPEAVRVMGGMWNICDAHYTRFLPRLRDEPVGTWLSGCFADYLFKGIAQDRRYKTLMGRAVPFFDAAPFSHQWYFGHGAIAGKWQGPVEARCAEMYQGCRLDATDDRARLEIEMRRLWPISREATIGSRLLLTRTLPWDVVLSDSAVVDVMLRIPARLKLNAQVWNAAVARICAGAAEVKNSNWGVTIGGSRARNMSEFLLRVARRKLSKLAPHAKASGPQLATTGSWPDYGYYMTHSPVLEDTWRATSPSHREVVNDVLGFDAWSLSLPEWAARDVTQWYRAMTLRLWLDRL
jgi:asparagine synthase (glutamine-hydrolysing)